MRAPILFTIISAGLLAACAVGPDYRKPNVELPTQFSAQSGDAGTQTDATASTALAQWWKGFNDDELNRLVDAALADNLDIQTASARIAQARAQADATSATLLPSLSASSSANRYRIPDAIRDLPQQTAASAGAAPGAASSFQIPGYLSIYRVGFDATWELDLWGGTRRSIEAANASAAAALYARRGAVVSTLAELGNDYAGLRVLQARIALAAQTEQADQQMLDLTQNRLEHGLASDLDVAQARSALAQTRAQLPPLQSQALQRIHAIAILLGRLPESMEQELGADHAPLSLPPAIPVGLPSEVLLNRPDVAEADRQMASANAQVGVAIAQRLPSISLTGSTGYASGALQDLLKHTAWTWNAGASLSAPIFDFGRLQANQRGAEAAAQTQFLQYRKTVLQALQDVEDSLDSYAAALRSNDALIAAVDAAQLTYQRASDQYRAGLGSYLNVLDADRSLYSVQDQLAQNQQMRVQSLISVYKALGGGWQAGEAQLQPQLQIDASWQGPPQ